MMSRSRSSLHVPLVSIAPGDRGEGAATSALHTLHTPLTCPAPHNPVQAHKNNFRSKRVSSMASGDVAALTPRHCTTGEDYETDGEQQQQHYNSFPGRATAGSEASTSYPSDEAEPHAAAVQPTGAKGWRGVAGALWGLLRRGNDIEGAVRMPRLLVWPTGWIACKGNLLSAYLQQLCSVPAMVLSAACWRVSWQCSSAVHGVSCTYMQGAAPMRYPCMHGGVVHAVIRPLRHRDTMRVGMHRE